MYPVGLGQGDLEMLVYWTECSFGSEGKQKSLKVVDYILYAADRRKEIIRLGIGPSFY